MIGSSAYEHFLHVACLPSRNTTPYCRAKLIDPFPSKYCSPTRCWFSQPIRTAFRSPWQNGIAERWVGCVLRDLLDHVIVLNQKHLRQLLNEYIRYYHEDRTHLGLGRTLLMVELRPPRHLTARSYRCGDSVACTTAIQRRPNNPGCELTRLSSGSAEIHA